LTLSLLMEALRPRRGVRPSYTLLHVFRALLILYREGPMGRRRLAQRLGIGETPARTLLRRLRDLGLADRDPAYGFYLTRRGFEEAARLAERIPVVADAGGVIGRDLRLDRAAYAGVLRGARLGGDWMRLRDVFVRRGATAAVIAVHRGSSLRIPPMWLGEDEYPSLARLRLLLSTRPGDYVVVCYAPTPMEAEEALVAGLLELLG